LVLTGNNRGGSRGRVQGVRPPPPTDDPPVSKTTGILQKTKTKTKTMRFIAGVEVEQETSAPLLKNPGSAPVIR